MCQISVEPDWRKTAKEKGHVVVLTKDMDVMLVGTGKHFTRKTVPFDAVCMRCFDIWLTPFPNIDEIEPCNVV